MSINLGRTQSYFVHRLLKDEAVPELQVKVGKELLSELSKGPMLFTDYSTGTTSEVEWLVAQRSLPGNKDLQKLFMKFMDEQMEAAVDGKVNVKDIKSGIEKAVNKMAELCEVAQEFHVISRNDIKALRALPNRKYVLMDRLTDQVIGIPVITDEKLFVPWFESVTHVKRLVHIDLDPVKIPGYMWWRIESAEPLVIDPDVTVYTSSSVRAPWRMILETVDARSGEVVTELDALSDLNAEDRSAVERRRALKKAGMTDADISAHLAQQAQTASIAAAVAAAIKAVK